MFEVRGDGATTLKQNHKGWFQVRELMVRAIAVMLARRDRHRHGLAIPSPMDWVY